MAAHLQNHYEILGVPRDADPTHIRRAYERWVREFAKDTTAPDPRREQLIAKAYEVLSNPPLRDAYDAELVAAPVIALKQKKPVIIAGVGMAVIAVALMVIFGRSGGGEAKPAGRPLDQIAMDASGSLAPLMSIDMSGKSTPAGFAFAIGEKEMVAACSQVSPGAQFVVNTGRREIPARITLADDQLGLCILATDTYAGTPLGLSATSVKAGDKVLSARVTGKGEVALTEVTVKSVTSEEKGQVIEAAVSGAPNGAPLLDRQGKVIAVATVAADGKVRHRPVPQTWLAENRPKATEPRPYQADPAAATGSPSAPGAAPGSAATAEDQDLDPESREILEARRKRYESLPPEQRARIEQFEAQAKKQLGDATRNSEKGK